MAGPAWAVVQPRRCSGILGMSGPPAVAPAGAPGAAGPGLSGAAPRQSRFPRSPALVRARPQMRQERWQEQRLRPRLGLPGMNDSYVARGLPALGNRPKL